MTDESVTPDESVPPLVETLITTGVQKLVFVTDDGLEYTIEFHPARSARYRRRLNRNEDPPGKVVRRFMEHELFWTEEQE